MNEFLKTRQDVDNATKYLQDNSLVESGLSCKNWEIAQVIPYMKDGNWLDMGSDGSVVLPNLLKKNINGKKYGIDLAYPENVVSPIGYTLVKGDLMNTPFQDGSFDFITSLSTIEHQVDFEKFAKECSRLLVIGGKLFVSFDFWEPKPDTSKMKLYSLDWNILDMIDVQKLIYIMNENNLVCTGKVDWSLQDAVINSTYCSPVQGVEYSFGILHFIKK